MWSIVVVIVYPHKSVDNYRTPRIRIYMSGYGINLQIDFVSPQLHCFRKICHDFHIHEFLSLFCILFRIYHFSLHATYNSTLLYITNA